MTLANITLKAVMTTMTMGHDSSTVRRKHYHLANMEYQTDGVTVAWTRGAAFEILRTALVARKAERLQLK